MGCRRSEYNNTCFGVFRDLSGSIGLQRFVSAADLTVSVRCDPQDTGQNNELSRWEMIEWEYRCRRLLRRLDGSIVRKRRVKCSA